MEDSTYISNAMGLSPTALLDSKYDIIASGSNYYSTSEDAVDIRIGGYEQCSKVELCSQLNCRSCNADNPCPAGSTCLYYDTSSSGSCFINCGGFFDSSCPCDSYCQELYGEGGVLNFCAPQSFFDSSDPCSQTSPFVANCTAPRLRQENYYLQSISVLVAVEGVEDVSTSGVSTVHISSVSCATSEDCLDGDICSVDRCIGGFCEYNYFRQCDSTDREILRLFRPQQALLFSFSNQTDSQSLFRSELFAKGQQSSAEVGTLADPAELRFSFNYFGNVIDSVQISPYGVVMIPPFIPCDGSFSSSKVITVQILETLS